MNQEILEQPLVITDERRDTLAERFGSFIPVLFAIGGSLLLAAARLGVDGDRFISDGALMMLALASYLVAEVFYLTNFYALFPLAEKLVF